MKFKVGDIVKIVYSTEEDSDWVKKGVSCEIVAIKEDDGFPYEVSNGKRSDWMMEDQVESLVVEKDLGAKEQVIEDIKEIVVRIKRIADIAENMPKEIKKDFALVFGLEVPVDADSCPFEECTKEGSHISSAIVKIGQEKVAHDIVTRFAAESLKEMLAR